MLQTSKELFYFNKCVSKPSTDSDCVHPVPYTKYQFKKIIIIKTFAKAIFVHFKFSMSKEMAREQS